MPVTDKFGWTMPTVGAHKNAWGQILNDIFDDMDQNIQRLTAVGSIAPIEPTDGDLWVDTSGGGEVLKVWSSAQWVTISAGSGANQLSELTDVGVSTPTSGNILAADGTDFDSKTPDSAGLVAKTGAQTIDGVKTFGSFPVTPSSAPTTDYQTANKKYVDDNGGGGGFNEYTGSKNNMIQDNEISIAHPSEISYDPRIVNFVREVLGVDTNWSTLDFDTGDEASFEQGDVKGTAVNFQLDTLGAQTGHFEDAVNAGVKIGAGKTEDRIQVGCRFYCDSTWFEIVSITDEGEAADEVEISLQDGSASSLAEGPHAVSYVYGTEFSGGVVQLNESGTAGVGNDSDTYLLLHGEGTDGSTTITDDAEGASGETVTANGDAQIDTDQKMWGDASIKLDGSGDYLSIPDHTNWDFFGSNSDNWTIDFWVKFSGPSGSETIFCQVEDSSNRYALLHSSVNGFDFIAKSGGADLVRLSDHGLISDANWHHYAICKVGDEWGAYLDGTQVQYTQDSDTDTFNGAFQIGMYGGSANPFNGHIDEFRIQHSNCFLAEPDAGGSSIPVPEEAYGASTAAYPVDQFYIITTTDSNRANTTDWENLKSATITEELNSQNIFYAFSFDGRTTWGIWDGTGGDDGWRPIARNNSGTWQFNAHTVAGATDVTWTNAATAGKNSQESALEQAFQVTANQMTGAETGAIADAEWNDQTGGMTGWSTSVTTLNVAAGLKTALATATPELDAIEVTYEAPTKWEPIVPDADWAIEMYATSTKLIKLGSGEESVVKGRVRIPK